MSRLNQTGEEQVVECPLCMELLEVDDLHFYPCTCGYQICRFCWNRLLESENGLCPACRKAYPENPADFTPLSQEQVAAIKTEKKAREQKRRNKTLESRKALANVRVVQNNLVFVVGLPVRLADPEILKRQEYFGKYGKIHKVVINQNTTYAGPQSPSASAYVTYVSPADALRAIQGVNNVTLDGRVLKGSLGTTKYCANFMKNQPCPKPDCMYLHEQGDPHASFTKEEMHAGLHQVYERKLHNQLLQSQRDRPADSTHTNATGNSSTNAEKSSSQEGNQSNFIPTTVVTSSHINVVNSSKSKKESSNGSGSGSSSGKEAWPSLGSSPPTDSPVRKQSSPKPTHNNVKLQENGTSESSSPTQPPTQQTAHNKNKDTHTDSKRNKDVSSQNSKKNKSEKAKQKITNSITSEPNDAEPPTERPTTSNTSNTPTTQNSVFEHTQQNYLSNELNELESDRHSLLENHDLLDNSDHNLLEDDSRNFLNDANNEVIMMQRHREMLADLVDNHHLMPKRPLTNGYGLIDREMSYLANDRPVSQISQGIMDQKELLMRERNRELLMRQNEMLARQHSAIVEPKHFMPNNSIGMDSASELLGANFHSNPNMLPFGMRVDNSMATNSMGASSMTSNMAGNNINTNLTTNTMAGNNMVTNTLNTMNSNVGNVFMLRNQQILQQNMHQLGIANGFDTPHSAASETRYQSDNMEKFFTDFHKAQQMRALLGHAADERRFATHNMLSADRLEMEHKQRMNNMRMNEGNGMRAAGDGDDDLDFDPFKETQKAFAEMMETEMMQNNVSGDSGARRSQFPPPGFSNAPPRRHTQHQGYNSGSAMFSDWTQMDPAIMSTSAVNGKPAGALTTQQQEMFARFNQMAVQPNGLAKLQVPLLPQWAGAQKLNWPSGAYSNIPLPPGFAPTKPPQHPAECIDAK